MTLALDLDTGAVRRDGMGRLAVLGAACLGLALLAIADLVTGPSGMPLAKVLSALAAGPDGAYRGAATILWQLRMPQTLTAMLVGASLGLSGLVMQTILSNPLASPYTLGFLAAAGFGAALGIMFGGLLPLAVWIVVPASAFDMTLLACGLIYAIARFRGASPEVLLVAASVIGKLISPGAAIPVGIITAVAGVPMLLVVILREGDRA